VVPPTSLDLEPFARHALPPSLPVDDASVAAGRLRLVGYVVRLWYGWLCVIADFMSPARLRSRHGATPQRRPVAPVRIVDRQESAMSEDELWVPAEEASPEAGLVEHIRRLRSAAGLGQAGLANLVGYSREYVSRTERPTKGLGSAELIPVSCMLAPMRPRLVTRSGSTRSSCRSSGADADRAEASIACHRSTGGHDR
jgi:DNA-binding XRE family transcriptional regulator